MARGSAITKKKIYIAEPLCDIIGEGPMTRGDVMKKIWAYIKKHDLQNEKNRRMIDPDEAMAQCFGKKSFSMFKLAGLIQEYICDE